MDKKDLKVEALLQRVAEITAQYESKIADLRVELTFLSQEVGELRQEKESANVDLAEASSDD